MADQLGHQDIVSAPVTTIMNGPVYTVFENLVLTHVLAAMITTGRRHLAVVDARGRCRGVVGDRAVAAAWADDPTSMGYLEVRHLLDARPSLVGTDATVGDVARRMHTDSVDAVAVIDRTGCPVGMVTGGDLIGLMARAGPPPTSPAATESAATDPAATDPSATDPAVTEPEADVAEDARP
jgi:CBS domain-containing protein